MMRALVALSLIGCGTVAPDVAFVLSDANDLPALQATFAGLRTAAYGPAHVLELERALDSGAKVLVIDPTEPTDPATDIVARAHERGIRIVAYGRELPDEELDALVMFDGYRAGMLQGEAALAAIGGRGTIAVLDTDARTSIDSEVARGRANMLAPHVASGAVTLVAPAIADAILATDGESARAWTRSAPSAFVASASGTNADAVCSGAQALDVRFDRAELARATGSIVRRLLAGEDLARDDSASRLPGKRYAVELARVSAFTARECNRADPEPDVAASATRTRRAGP